MKEIDMVEAGQQIGHWLDSVAAGAEVVITRRGRPAARLVAVEKPVVRFPDRSALRAELPPMREGATETIRALRDDARF